MGQRLNYILNYNSTSCNLFSNVGKLFSQRGNTFSLTYAQKLPNKVFFRTLLVVLMMLSGITGIWGQTPDYSGIYYIASDYQNKNTTTRNYNPTTLSNNYYLCPTENWISFGSSGDTKDTWTTGDSNPFLTTYKACAHNDYDITNAKWTIEYRTTEDNKDYYYIKHSSGQYMVLNKQIDGVSGNSPENRIRVHLETLTAEQLKVEATRNLALFSITQDGRSIYICPKTQSSVHLTVNNGNGDYLRGNGNNKGYITSSSTTYGMEGTIGIYGNNNQDDNKYFYLEEVKCFTPTISYDNSTGEITITSNTVGATIKYTLDGTDPSTGTPYDGNNKPVINSRTVVKAIATKSYKEDSEVVTQTIVMSPTIDPIASVTYNGSAQEPTVTVKDGDDTIDEDEYTVSYSNNTNAGTATVTITDKDGGVYFISGSTTFTINKAPVTVTANATGKGYGDAEPALTFTATGLQGSDTEANAFTGSLTRVAGEAKGTYAISQGTLASANYNITFVGADFTITNKSLTITADSDTKVYDGTPLTKNTYTNTALLEGHSLTSVTITGSQTNAGNSANVPSGAVIKNGSNEDVTDNYNIIYTNGTLTVTPKPITITADGDTKVYDGTALTKDTYTNTALATGDAITSVTFTGSQTVVGTSNNVPSAAVIQNAGSEDVTASYNITYSNGTLEVTQKALTITADGDTKVYDGTALTKNTYTNTALATGDAITSVTFTGSQTTVGSSSNVPSAAVIKNGSNENVSASYDITYTNGTLAVTRASVTVKADNASKIYGEEDPASFTTTVTGLVNNESESLITRTASRAEGENAGIYTITPTGDATQGNYTVSYLTGAFTITPKSLGDGVRPATGFTVTPGVSDITVEDGGSPLTENTDYTLVNENDVVTITGINNYTGSAKVICSSATFERPDNTSDYGVAFLSGLDIVPPDGVTAYVVKKVSPTIGTVTITPICYIPEGESEYVGYVPEGVPVILMTSAERSGFAVSPIEEGTEPLSDAILSSIRSNQLQVAPDKPSDPTNPSSAHGLAVKNAQAYMYYKGEFVLTLEGVIKPGKIYLNNPNYTESTTTPAPPAPARSLRIVVEENETSIKSLPLTPPEGKGTIFDLAGRRVQGARSKGLYITKRKKVVLR